MSSNTTVAVPRDTPGAEQPQPTQANVGLRTFVSWAGRLLAGGIFIYTGVLKLKEPANFAKEIRGYNLVPVEATNAMALYLPWLEVLAGVLVLLPAIRREARLLLILMLAVFTVAKGYALTKGLKIHCGCVPATSPLRFLFDGWPGIATNVVLLVLLLADQIWSVRNRYRTPVQPG